MFDFINEMNYKVQTHYEANKDAVWLRFLKPPFGKLLPLVDQKEMNFD